VNGFWKGVVSALGSPESWLGLTVINGINIGASLTAHEFGVAAFNGLMVVYSAWGCRAAWRRK